MPYNINKSNGDLLVVIEDGTADLNTTSLALVGRNYAGYGEYLNENLVKLLENFARTTQPSSPLMGQLWYDTANKLLKVYDGVSFVSSGGGIELDRTSTNVNYTTFVESDTGLPPTKTAKEKGLVFQPSTGNYALNKATPGTSKLEINNGVSATRSLNSTLNDTVVHVHSDNGQAIRMLFDGYGGATTVSPTITFRRGPLFGGTGTSNATQLGSVIGSIGGRGYTGAEFSVDRAAINIMASQSWTGAGNGTKIEFQTTQNGTTVTETKAIIHHNGDFEVKGDIIGFSLSDERLKTDIVKIENALETLVKLTGVTFRWNDKVEIHNKSTLSIDTGLLAGQVHNVFPAATAERKNGYLAVNYQKLIGLLVEGIKELKSEVDHLRATRIA